MESIQLKININRLKYGDIFLIINDLIHTYDLYSFVPLPGHYLLIYVELCELFFATVNKNLEYQNYILKLTGKKYDSLVKECFNRSVYLKDKDQYKINKEIYTAFLTKLKEYMFIYLDQFKSQINQKITFESMNNALLTENLNIKVITCNDLENHYSNFQNQRSQSLQLLKKTTAEPRDHKLLPKVKMQPIYPRPPMLGKNNEIVIPKNYLDE